MSVHSIKKAERPRAAMTLETKLKITVDFDVGKRVVNVGVELGIPDMNLEYRT
jgi:hypothetical protein